MGKCKCTLIKKFEVSYQRMVLTEAESRQQEDFNE